ncbi:MAG: hypothetical protein HZA17_13880 [Nitrospirae bacterium]|nr:hypothetical protein [Nitrospirota bacterium]
MKRFRIKFKILLAGVAALLAFASYSQAIMGPGSGMMPGGPMMTNTGSFGMMNGMAATPVVGADGTAFLVTYDRTTNPGTTPNSNSFQSKIIAVTPSGSTSSVTLNGIVSRPVVTGNILVATASLPDFADYTMFGNFGNNPISSQSALYIVPAPFSSTTEPLALSLDGGFASVPVIAGNLIYVVTSDYGNAMMSGSATFTNMYGNYNFNGSGTAKTYLYIFNFDGTLASKTTVE